MNEMISPPVDAYLPEIEDNLEFGLLETRQAREEAREQLAEIVEVAFINSPALQESDFNFILEIPDSMYYSVNTVICTLTDRESNQIQGFTLLQKRDNETYYEAITAVRRPNQGQGTKILKERDNMLKAKGAKYVVTHVDKDGKYAEFLKRRYEQAETTEKDIIGQAPHQETLRLKL